MHVSHKGTPRASKKWRSEAWLNAMDLGKNKILFKMTAILTDFQSSPVRVRKEHRHIERGYQTQRRLNARRS